MANQDLLIDHRHLTPKPSGYADGMALNSVKGVYWAIMNELCIYQSVKILRS
jgi:hypothetical protein